MNRIYHCLPQHPDDARELRLRHASCWWQRLRGLIAHPPLPAGEGLLIMPCRAVHTAFMSFALDLVFLNSDGRICKLVNALPPWRIAGCWQAQSTLELRAGEIERLRLVPGEQLRAADAPLP